MPEVNPTINPLEIPKVKELLDKIPAEARPKAEEVIQILWEHGEANFDIWLEDMLFDYTQLPMPQGTFEHSLARLLIELSDADDYHEKIQANKAAIAKALKEIALTILLAKLG